MISYVVKVNNVVIHDSFNNNILLDAKGSLKKNDISFFNFATLEVIATIRDIVVIEKNGIQIFCGRIITVDKNMESSGLMYYSYYCEDLISLFRDITSPLLTTNSNVRGAIESIVTAYNRPSTIKVVLEAVESEQSLVFTTGETKGLSLFDSLMLLMKQVPFLTYQGNWRNGKLYISLKKQKQDSNIFVFHEEIDSVKETLDGTQFINSVIAISEWTWIEDKYELVCRWEN
jgi:hypothetical protein